MTLHGCCKVFCWVISNLDIQLQHRSTEVRYGWLLKHTYTVVKVDGATPKRRLVRGHHKPIHGICAIYFLGGVLQTPNSPSGVWMSQWKKLGVGSSQEGVGWLQITSLSLSRPGPWKKFERLMFPTKYVIPKSWKFSHWPSKSNLLQVLSWRVCTDVLALGPFHLLEVVGKKSKNIPQMVVSWFTMVSTIRKNIP